MKSANNEQIRVMVSYFNTSAYVQVSEITALAIELIEDDEDLKDVEDSIFDDINQSLDGYEYVECEGQVRHIWHKLEE